VLNFIYYPVSFILWCWHKVFGAILGPGNGVAWALSIIFLVFTLRAILYKPFIKQVRSMRKMQEFAPEIKKIQKKYANDRQKQALEMQRLQKEHGVSPLGGCLPILAQIPVFIGLNQVIREFKPGKTENYFFGHVDVSSYVDAHLFGAKLSNFVFEPQAILNAVHVDRWEQAWVSIPLMIVASIATHFTARHSVSRQNPDAATPQTAIMNKITLYLFPLGVLIFGAFFPLGLLFYWLANNIWTLTQQHFVYQRIDREEAEQKVKVVETRKALGPKPGQKPVQPKNKRPAPGTVTPPPTAGMIENNDESAGSEIPGLISDRSRKKQDRKRP
jgi:YidC/Oxa1 family membrane protein insertase